MKLDRDFLDYPDAWEIQRELGGHLVHQKGCSSVPEPKEPLAGPGFLCDCGAVVRMWEWLKAEFNQQKQSSSS